MKTTKILSLLMVVTLPMLLMAQPPMGPGPQPCDEGSGFDYPMMLENLNLTEDQVVSMDKLKTEHKKAMIQLESDLKLARLELDELIKNEAPEKKIDVAIDQVSAIKAKILKARIHQKLDMGKLLTDEQKEMLKKQRREMMKKHRSGRKNMRKGPGGCKDDCKRPEMAPEQAPTE